MANSVGVRAKKSISKVLKEYDGAFRTYADLAASLRTLISDLLAADDIRVHSVTCRVKTRESLVEKLNRDGTRYLSLAQVTDVCGLRVITYFPDAVDKVASVLEREFTIDRVNSVDKRTNLDADRFGYLSVHHILSIGVERARLAEYRRFGGLKVEVQTRSLLQHTWAEIEHDLGYRSGPDVPRQLRRRFARLAGLLELADEEFQEIRDQLKRYEEDVVGLISESPQDVGLNKASLVAFVTSSSLLEEIERDLCAFRGADLVASDPDFLNGDAEKLTATGINSIAELESVLVQRREVLLAFAEIWLDGDTHPAFDKGIGFLYLWYVLVAGSRTPQQIRQLLEDINLGHPDERNESAELILKTYKDALEKVARTKN